jgi:putative peptidoglycan lipid II flippase
VAAAAALSRVAGLVRERFLAQYLGTSAAADAFTAALRIPLLVDGVLGERTLSSAFIPRYSRLVAEGSPALASRLAWTVASLHFLIVAGLVVAGVLLAPQLVASVARGFDPATAGLTVRLLRILFPAVGLLAFGSWCLSVLTSHRVFFLPHIVPVLSAASISVALIWAGSDRDRSTVAVYAAWGALAGALLQVLVQVPFVRQSMAAAEPGSTASRAHVRDVGRRAVPAVQRGLIGRAATWVEVAIAGYVSTGAVAALGYAQLVYSVPVGLFTVAVSTALLPELSGIRSDDDGLSSRLSGALDSALRHTAYLLVGCAGAFIALGDVLVAAVYQGGRFGAADVVYVWAILGAMSAGLVGVSMGGLYATAFYALGDTRTPLRAAIVRLGARAVLGLVLAIPVVRLLGLDPKWGAAGLGTAIGLIGWIEFALLRRWLDARLGLARPPGFARFLVQLWAIAAAAAAVAWLVKLGVPAAGPIGRAAATLGAYGAVYVGTTLVAGMREPASLIAQLRLRR